MPVPTATVNPSASLLIYEPSLLSYYQQVLLRHQLLNSAGAGLTASANLLRPTSLGLQQPVALNAAQPTPPQSTPTPNTFNRALAVAGLLSLGESDSDKLKYSQQSAKKAPPPPSSPALHKGQTRETAVQVNRSVRSDSDKSTPTDEKTT